ncbi:MAG: RDD family protein [Acidobacteria bacterium]|nr:RDD family protein [Acidobacteriota bacterium]
MGGSPSPVAPPPYVGSQSHPYSGTQPQAAAYGLQSAYAGFWIRFVAYIIDSIVVFIGLMIIVIPVAVILGVMGAVGATSGSGPSFKGLEGPLTALWYVVSFGGQWLYEAFMDSSAKQATLGKMAMGLIVTDVDGNRISFGRATGRFFAKILSGVILAIGYLMQPFTQKKQALHDILAGTLVLKRP